MKKYLTGIGTILFAAILAISTTAFKKHAPVKHMTTDFYYEFTGSHGQESTMTLWSQLADENAYDDFDCTSGSNNSCKIINTTNSSSHPTSVPLDASGFPKIGTVNLDRELKQ